MSLAFACLLFAANGCIGNSSTTGIDIDDSIITKPMTGTSEGGESGMTQKENTIKACTDGIDNDADTLVDCNDPDCQDKGSNGQNGPGATVCVPCSIDGKNCFTGFAEDNEYSCSDGIDNDGDSYTDCGDRSCQNTVYCCPSSSPENTLEACSDGVDNDCNGYIDCNDNSCKKSTDPDVKTYCQAKICGDKCTTGKEETIELCTDGVDNDMNGYTDCKDNGCKNLAVCNSGTLLGSLVEDCKDKIDNDLDGKTDCDDSDCEDDQYCEDVEAETGARASGFNLLPEAEKVEIYKNEYRLCTDAIDNDKNGKTDCEEYRCQVLSLTDLSALEQKYNLQGQLNFTCFPD